jgi:hypothetical protein
MRACPRPHMCGLAGGACAAGREGHMRPSPDGRMHPSELRGEPSRRQATCSSPIPSAMYKRGMGESIERLSYELTASALAEQERTIAGLRACAGTVLGAASVAGSLLGATASRGVLDLWGLFALNSFVLCVANAVWVLMPHQLVVALSGEELLGDSDRHDRVDVGEAYRAFGKLGRAASTSQQAQDRSSRKPPDRELPAARDRGRSLDPQPDRLTSR